MRVGVGLAAMLLSWSPSPPVSAQDDLVLHTYPYAGADIEALYDTRPESSRIDLTSMPEATPEDGARLEILASQSQVVSVRVDAAWQGSIAGCGNRLWYSADSSTITQRADGSFDVAMKGFWLWDVTSRPGGLTQGVCSEKVQERTEFTATLMVSLESGPPVVATTTGVAVPERATTAPVADPPPPGTTPDERADDDVADEPVTDVDGSVIPGVDAEAPSSPNDDSADDAASASSEQGDSDSDVTETRPASKGWSTTVWMVLLLGVAGGAVGVWIALKGLFLLPKGRPFNPLLRKPRELSRAIEKEWNKGVTDPDPTYIEYDEDRIEWDNDNREDQIDLPLPTTAPSSPAPAPAAAPPQDAPATSFSPSHEIVLDGEVDTGRAPGHALEGTRVTLLEPGQQVEVISVKGYSATGGYVYVRRSDGPPLRVDRRNLRSISHRD